MNSCLRGLLLSASLGAWLLGSAAPSRAQPQTNPAGVRAQWLQLRRTWSPVELTDPQSAVAAYGKFYNSLTNESGDVGIEIVSRVAQLYGNELGQRDRALQIYREAMKNWRAPKQLARLQREYDLMSGFKPNDNIGTTAPIAATSVAPVDLQVAPETQAKAGTLVELLAAGRNPDELWASGEWKSADVVWALQNILTDDGLLKGRPNQGQQVREALASLLGQHGGELVSEENWRVLPTKARLWLGDYYRRQDNDNAVAILESVLSQAETAKIPSSTMFVAFESLGWFYQDRKQYDEAAQTWLRLPKLAPDASWMTADANWQALSNYMRDGQQDKARAMFPLVNDANSPLFTGLSQLWLSTPLVEARRYGEARELLQTPLKDGDKVEIVRIARLARLAYTHYKEGDFDKTREAVETAVARYEQFTKDNPNIREDLGLKREIDDAQLYLKYIERWKNAPLRVLPEDVKLIVKSVDGQPQIAKARLSLRTYRVSDFKLESEAPYVKASLVYGDESWTKEKRAYAEQEMVLEIDPTLLPTGEGELLTSVLVTVMGEKPYELRVPITIARG